MKNKPKIIIKYLIEFLIVAFGVFLGIYASEVQNQEKIRKEKEKSIEYIVEELDNNRSKLEKTFAYHESIKTEIEKIAKNLNEDDFFTPYIGNEKFRHTEIKGWNGVNTANLNDTAFEAAKISGIIKEFDFKTIQEISEVYKFQKEYSDFGKSVLDKMISLNSSSKISDVYGSIELMAYDLRSYERSLINAIDRLQSEIDASTN